MKSAYQLVTAKALDEHRIFVAGIPDTGDEPPSPGTARLLAADLSRSEGWELHPMPLAAVSLAGLVDRKGRVTLAALSEEGECWLRADGEEEVEEIADAGLHRRGAARYGYLLSLRQIGAHLHACGARGQVYRRSAKGRWEHTDEGILQPQNEMRRLVLHAIEGTSEDDIYVAGDVLSGGFKGRLFHRDGAGWRAIEVPATRGLNAIHLDADGQIWLVSADGAIVTGRRTGGFERLLDEPNPHLFHDVTRYAGTIYLASSRGLFRWDEAKKRPVRVRTGLVREIEYASYVEAAGGALWCAGPRDVLRFDGQRWARLAPIPAVA